MAHQATAKFHETGIGEGIGFSKGAAKRDAARAALQYIHKHGLPDPGENQDPDAVLDLQNYLRNRTEDSLIPWFSWSVSQTGPGGSHRATVQFDGSEIGHGIGFSVDHAKQIAAAQGLEYNRHLYPIPRKGQRTNQIG